MTILDNSLNRKVRAILRTETLISQAVFNIAKKARDSWTPATWSLKLRELDACEDTLEDWLAIHN